MTDMLPDAALTGAHISACGQYRTLLWRKWGGGKALLFIMLNPSTADAQADDPTIRKCKGFAKRLGFDGIEVVNLYPYRATAPADLWAFEDQIPGDVAQENNLVAIAAAKRASMVICAWGAQARRDRERAGGLMATLRKHGCSDKLHALRLLADGMPEHPLMLPYTCKPVQLAQESGQA